MTKGQGYRYNWRKLEFGILQTRKQSFKSLSQKFNHTEFYRQHYIEEEHTLLKMFQGLRKVHVLCGLIQLTVMSPKIGLQVASICCLCHSSSHADTFSAYIVNCIPRCWCWTEILPYWTFGSFLSCFHLQ